MSRSRGQRVATRGLAFSDASDSHDALSSVAGEGLPPSTGQGPVPRDRFSVHRSYWRFGESPESLYLPSALRSLLNLSNPPLTRGGTYPQVHRARPTERTALVGPVGKSPPVRSLISLNRLSFALPHRTKECVRRRQRKSVLFALKVAGRRRHHGSGGSYRRRPESQWSC